MSLCVCVCICVQSQMVSVFGHVCVSVSLCVCVCKELLSVSVFGHTSFCLCIFVCACVRVCVCACVRVCVSVFGFVCFFFFFRTRQKKSTKCISFKNSKTYSSAIYLTETHLKYGSCLFHDFDAGLTCRHFGLNPFFSQNVRYSIEV